MGINRTFLWTKATPREDVLKGVAVVAGRFALTQAKDVGKAKQHRNERGQKRSQERALQHHQQNEKQRDARADAADEPPEQTTFQTPSATIGVRRGIGIGQA